MQNPIQKIRQSLIVSEKPGVLYEKIQTFDEIQLQQYLQKTFLKFSLQTFYLDFLVI